MPASSKGSKQSAAPQNLRVHPSHRKPPISDGHPRFDLQVRSELGLGEGSHLAVFIYGGQPPGEWRLEASSLPPGWTCVVCSAGRPPQGVELPPNFILAQEDAYTPDLVRVSFFLMA